MIRLLLATLLLFLPLPLAAQVLLSFHSFNGSMFGGRFPHTFVVMEGTLEATGEPVSANYGYSAKSTGPNVLLGPAEHMIISEEAKYIGSTNRHFTVPISDEQYRRIEVEMVKWRDFPGKGYRLDENNCIHFVGAVAQIAGLTVDVPKKLVRKPKAWLNHITELNPQLGAKAIK